MVRLGGVPVKAKPASLRMELRPPSQPISQAQRAWPGPVGADQPTSTTSRCGAGARNLAPASQRDVERGRPLAQDRLQALLVDPAHAPFGLVLRAGSNGK